MNTDDFCIILTEGLDFPEAPLPLADGSLWFTEVLGNCLTHRAPDGSLRRLPVAAGPNGLALARDGGILCVANGGFDFVEIDGVRVPTTAAPGYDGGAVQICDPETGKISTLYTECDGRRLSAPNDIVVDAQGGFYFTDTGKTFDRSRDHGGVYYALQDGSAIRPVVYPLVTPNGIGLSPDGATLFVAETETARLWAFDLSGPGEIARGPALNGGRLIIGLGGATDEHLMIDSLAVTRDGLICLATLLGHCITVIDPGASAGNRIVARIPVPDLFPTNIAFSSDETQAFVTLAATGRLARLDWHAAMARHATY